jgi:hypothetical protein
MEIENKCLLAILKKIEAKYTVTTLALDIGLSRVGTWKIMKKLEFSGFIGMKKIGSGKTSTGIISLNWENPLTQKRLELILIEEALTKQRWQKTFEALESVTHLSLLFGSVLRTPKEAIDIDLLNIASKDRFILLDKALNRIQVTQARKIHATNFTKEELIAELKKPNTAIADAMKGVVLYGAEEYVRIMRDFHE